MPKINKNMYSIIEALSIRFNNIVYEKKQKGVEVIVLSLGEAFFNIPLFPFDDLPFPDIYHYSHSRGLFSLRKKIAKYFKNQYDFAFNPRSQIIITAGSKIAVYMAFLSLLEPNDEVLVFEPYWVSYTEQIKLCNARPITIPKDLSIYEIEKFFTAKTKCIVINHPNNPAGKIYTREELMFLLDFCRLKDLYIISDEAYSDFLPDGQQFISLGTLDKKLYNSIVCNSISKNYGLSGWRLGYIISNSKLMQQILKINQHLITCPATILEYYIDKHFDEIISITKPQIQNVVKKRFLIKKFLSEEGFKYEEGDAAWYFLVSIYPSKLKSIDFCLKLLEEENICVVPGIGYGGSCEHHIRVAIGSEPVERIKHGIKKIKELILKTS